MRFKVYLLRRKGRRLPRSEVLNGPSVIGELTTNTTRYGQEDYRVATLTPIAGSPGPRPISDLYEPVLLGFAPLAFRLRGFERVREGDNAFSVVQEWHVEVPW